MQVVYEDNHIIIVSKRSGEIVQGDKTGDEPLSETVKQYIKEKYQKPGNVFLGVVHRLDRPVSGLVVFAKTSKALSRLNTMFRDGEVHKTYWAIVKNMPKETEATLTHWIVRNEKQNKPKMTPAPVPSCIGRSLSTSTSVCGLICAERIIRISSRVVITASISCPAYSS